MPQPRSSYQLHVQLQGPSPAAWRRLRVSDRTTFAQLHQIIAAAMDWPSPPRTRYAFEIAGQRYGWPDPDQPDDPTLDARRYSLRQLLRGQHLPMRYWHASADPSWLHRIRLELSSPEAADTDSIAVSAPQCLAGRHLRPALAPAHLLAPPPWPMPQVDASWTRSTQPQTTWAQQPGVAAQLHARFDRAAVQQRLDALNLEAGTHSQARKKQSDLP